MSSSIVVNGLTFQYPPSQRPVLNGVSLCAEAGEVRGLAGPPGAGKTTLCMAIAGLVPAVTGGQVWGTVEGDWGVGVVFEDPTSQLIQLRVLSEVADPLQTRGASREQAEQQARRLLERVGLPGDELAKRWVWQLSEGQRILLALAATLATRPEVLVLHEVMGHLDAAHRADLLRVLNEEAGDRTVVLVEQDAPCLPS